MTPTDLLAAAAAWLLVAAPGPPMRAARRARRLVGGGSRPPALVVEVGEPRARSTRLRASVSVLVACVSAVVLGAAGLLLAPLVGAAAWVMLGRLEPAAVRRRREQVVRDLPSASDLLVACTAAGAAPRACLDAVGQAVGGPVGEALAGAAAAARLGAPVDDVARASAADPALVPMVPVVTALARSEDDGTALSRSLQQVAADLRADRAHRVAAVARQAGVRATVPLGLCFLPAFVLVGLVPVVAGVAAS